MFFLNGILFGAETTMLNFIYELTQLLSSNVVKRNCRS